MSNGYYDKEYQRDSLWESLLPGPLGFTEPVGRGESQRPGDPLTYPCGYVVECAVVNILTNSCGLIIGSAVVDLAKYLVNVQTY